MTVDQWPALIQEIFRVTRPGGYIQLCEADFYVRFPCSCCLISTTHFGPLMYCLTPESDDRKPYRQNFYWTQYVSCCFCYKRISYVLTISVAVCKIVENRGQDPRIALKLRPILVSAGFEDVVLEKRRVHFSKLTVSKLTCIERCASQNSDLFFLIRRW
jgi:hypothetical protein